MKNDSFRFSKFKYNVGDILYTYWQDNEECFLIGNGKILKRKFRIKYLTEKKDIAHLVKEYEWIHKNKKDGEIIILNILEDHLFRNKEEAVKDYMEWIDRLNKIIGEFTTPESPPQPAEQ